MRPLRDGKEVAEWQPPRSQLVYRQSSVVVVQACAAFYRVTTGIIRKRVPPPLLPKMPCPVPGPPSPPSLGRARPV